jgi:cytochrome c oxidase assembly protein subunit 15
LYLLTLACFLSVLIQTGLGAWVSSNYAVLACDTYPMCQNSWWPDMNMDKAFELWRGLGLDADGQALPFQALTAIHMVHRWHALVPALLLLLVAACWLQTGLKNPARLLSVLLLLQFATGISNAVLGWPMLAALLHTGSAAALLLVLTWTLASTRPRRSDRIAATFNRHML